MRTDTGWASTPGTVSANSGGFRAAARSRGTGLDPVPRFRPDRPSGYDELAWRFPGQHTRSPTMAPLAARRESAGTSARAVETGPALLSRFSGVHGLLSQDTPVCGSVRRHAHLDVSRYAWTGQADHLWRGEGHAQHCHPTDPDQPLSICTWCTRDAWRWRIDRQFGHRLHIYSPASCELTQLHFRASVLHARPTGPRQRPPQNQDRERAQIFLLAWLTFCGHPVAPSPQVVLSGSGRESQSCFPYFSGLEKSLSVRR
jgi:hypothetical protein